MAEHLATFAPFVPRFMKAMVHSGMEASLVAGLLEKFAQGALCQTEDKKEGLRAFLSARPSGRDVSRWARRRLRHDQVCFEGGA